MFFPGRTVAKAVLMVAPAFLASAAWAGSLTRIDQDHVSVRASGVPVGQVLSELDGMKRLNNLFIEPAIAGRAISVTIDKVGLTDAAVQILTQSGLDFIVWGDRIFVGDPKAAVQMRAAGQAESAAPAPEAVVAEAAAPSVEEVPASSTYSTSEFSMVGENVTYGMALFVDTQYGVTVVHHGGDLAGYHSDMIWLPDYGVGAVILTNADSGVIIRGPLLRRLLEVLFDGKPEAARMLEVAAAQRKAGIAKARERLVVPADPAAVAKLAPRYVSTALGEVRVVKDGQATVFDVGEWKSAVASRKNDDGTISFITIDPTLDGFEFVVADKDGKRRLITRDAQHEYVFEEAPAKKSS